MTPPTDLEARLRRAIACGDPELSVTVVGGRPAGHFIVRVPRAPTRMDVRDIAKHLDFTQAQARVLDLLVEGLSNATISARLGIAERTVEAHLTAMLRKSGLASRGALIARILR